MKVSYKINFDNGKFFISGKNTKDVQKFLYQNATLKNDETISHLIENSLKYNVPDYTPDGASQLIETKDNDNESIIIDIYENQIMMEWEKPYMDALVDSLKPFGDVLEFGFGLGYSANRILEYNINSYTVIENDPIIYAKAKQWAKDSNQTKKINIIYGDWKNSIHCLGEFDCFFFDTAEFIETPTGLGFFLSVLKHLKGYARYAAYYCEKPKAELSLDKNIVLLDKRGNTARTSQSKKTIIVNKFKPYECKIPNKCKYISKGKQLYLYVLEVHKENLVKSLENNLLQ